MMQVTLDRLDHALDQFLPLQMMTDQPGLDIHDLVGHLTGQVPVLIPQLFYIAAGDQPGDVGGQ